MTPFKHSNAVFIPGILSGSLPPEENSSQKIGDGSLDVFLVQKRHWYLASQNKYQLSLTNPRYVLHHGIRAANKGGRSCDRTKLTTLATVDVFESEFFVESLQF